MIYAVSDLHLGEGAGLEDFALWPGRLPRRKTPASVAPSVEAMHTAWREFLERALSRPRRPGEPPHELLLLGDIFDLLQIEGPPGDPGKIERAARAHGPWFESLQRAAARGMRVTLVAGNHDHELLAPEVWAALLRHLPFLNEASGGGPLLEWRRPELGIHAEHGMQFDPANAFADPADPLALSLGGHVTLGLLNPFEPSCPLLDLMPGVAPALWYALTRAPGLLTRPLRDFLFGPPRSGGGAKANLDFLPDLEVFLRRLWLKDLPAARRSELRRALGQIAGALAPCEAASHPLERVRGLARRRDSRLRRSRARGLAAQFARLHPGAPPLRVLLTGHTHEAGIEAPGEGAGAPRLVNTGSWKARARPAGRSRFTIEQTLDVLEIEGEGPENLRILLRSARPGLSPAAADSGRLLFPAASKRQHRRSVAGENLAE